MKKIKHKFWFCLLSTLIPVGFLMGCDETSIPGLDFGDKNKENLYGVELSIPLSTELQETSGLIVFRHKLWTINDSGSENIIYVLDSDSGKVIQRIRIINAENIDWEDIAQDDSCIYVADVGNNKGDRKDLAIYKILKSAISDSSYVEVQGKSISYSYSDQTDFTPADLANSYDCEALLTFGDSLFLFTKDWVTNTSSVYTLPKIPGNYITKKKTILQVNGLITGVDLFPSTKELVFCGYYNFEPFLLHLSTIEDLYKSPGFERQSFPDNFGVQMEGIGFITEDTIFISSEKSPVQAQTLLKLVAKEN